MAIADRNLSSRLSYGGRINPLVMLIAVTMIVFVALMFFRALTYIQLPENADLNTVYNQKVLKWFALAGSTEQTLPRIWTILTYGFSHINLWQLFASMLWLWGFGYVFMDMTGNKRIVPVYLYGVLIGGIAYLAANYFLGTASSASFLIGSSSGILAVAAAATTICPNYKILPMVGGGISLWIVSIIYLAIDMATLPPDNLSVYVSHLAGALTGFLFIFILRRGFDASEWMNNFYDWLVNLVNPEKPYQSREKIKSAFFYNAKTTPYVKTPKITQQKLDEILDKISQYGYDQLTEEEKSFLERASKEDLKGRQ